MAKIIGRLKDVGIALESVRGVGVAPSFWVPKTNFTVEDKALKARTEDNYGTIIGSGNQSIPARLHSEGEIEMDMYDKTLGALLYALFGSKSVSGPSDSAYTHTFTIANSAQHPSLTICAKESTLSELMFKLSMINSFKMVVIPNDVVKLTIGFMGKKSVSTSQTVTYTAQGKFVGRDLVFKLATLTSGLAGASAISIKRLELNIEKNTMLDHPLGTVQPEDILNQAMRISGSVELDYQDRTYADLMTAGSYRAMRIQLLNQRADALIGVSTNPAFLLDLSRVEFDQWESNFANDDIAKQTFNFMALHDITNGNTVNSCTLINAQSSY